MLILRRILRTGFQVGLVAAATAWMAQGYALAAHPPAPAPSPVICVQPSDDGYNVSLSDFSFHVGPTGSLTNVMACGQPLFERAYLEVRDKTWHVRLQPQRQQVKAFPPYLDKDAQKFQFTIQMDDPGTGIRLAVDELVVVRPKAEVQVVLTVTPQAQFEARRISWNVVFLAARFAGKACAWQSGKGPQSTLQFPADRSSAPTLAHQFDWLRLNAGDGPVDFRFEASDPKNKTVLPDCLLEDLRWWNSPNFWIADSFPYPHQDADPEKPMEVAPGDAKTLRITMVLHCGDKS